MALIAIVALLCGLVGFTWGASLQTARRPLAAHTAPSPTISPSSPSNQALPTPGPSSSSGTTPGGTPDAGAIAAHVDKAIVDINTTLASGQGAGTGMVLTASGLVVTNNHVIADATEVHAQIAGTGTTYTATVLGYDIVDDVALLQLQGASGLQTVDVADSSAVKVADAVVALGNALGRGGTPAVSQGSVTALDQQIDVTNDDGTTSTLSGLIEISARLQPGDSGGPVVNAAGEVIAMNAAATTARRHTTNDAFAIPINTALDVGRQIETGQSTTRVHVGPRAMLGIQLQASRGTAVAAVQPGSPAEAAGLQPGDTIVSIETTSITALADLQAALEQHQPGDSVAVGWVDDSGQHHRASITLIAGPPA